LSVARNPLRSVGSTKEIVYDLLYVGIVLMFTLDSPPTYRVRYPTVQVQVPGTSIDYGT
jgi:hypothetical protein